MPPEQLEPELVEGVTPVAWSGRPGESPAELYERYGQQVASVVVETVSEVRSAEPVITGQVLQAVQTAGATSPDQLLQYRMKAPSSLARKVQTKSRGPAGREGAGAVVARMTDVLRYTAIAADHDRIVPTARALVEQLREVGWEVVEVEHSYVQGNPYKGLHIIARPPGSRLRGVELQVHSEQSQRVKNRYHADYEVARDPTATKADQQAAGARMRRAWSRVPQPAGIERLRTLGGVAVEQKKYG